MLDKRMVVTIEGQIYANGRMIERGALHVDDDRIIVTHNGFARVVGYAEDLERDSTTGKVSMVIHISPDNTLTLAEDKLYVDVYLSPVKYRRTGNPLVIKDGRIRSINLTYK